MIRRRVTIAKLRAIERLAVNGATEHAAARAIGLPVTQVRWHAKKHRLRFAPVQNRGVPDWLMPELARQAEIALRATVARVTAGSMMPCR